MLKAWETEFKAGASAKVVAALKWRANLCSAYELSTHMRQKLLKARIRFEEGAILLGVHSCARTNGMMGGITRIIRTQPQHRRLDVCITGKSFLPAASSA